jgi:hypothetical protein
MTTEQNPIGAIKIKDGLFVGDEFAAQVICKRVSIGFRVCCSE